VIITSVRNLTRSFLACTIPDSTNKVTITDYDKADTERVVRILVAILYATKNHLRAEWGAEIIPGTAISHNTGDSTLIPEYSELLPHGLTGLNDRGVGLPLQLTFFVEQYIKRFFNKGAFHGPQASQMQVQLNVLTDAYGRMETIRLTGIPVAHL
jgi:putative membrane protein